MVISVNKERRINLHVFTHPLTDFSDWDFAARINWIALGVSAKDDALIELKLEFKINLVELDARLMAKGLQCAGVR